MTEDAKVAKFQALENLTFSPTYAVVHHTFHPQKVARDYNKRTLSDSA
jgi:hypothetical protein